MFKRPVLSFICSLFIIGGLFISSPAYADTTIINQDVNVNLPINQGMETKDNLPNLNTSGSSVLTQDRVQGNYAAKVSANTNSSGSSVEYTLASTQQSYDISKYSKIKLWVKPSLRAKWIQFFANNGTSDSLIKCDVNQDGKFEVGTDLISGKWNEVTLDLTKVQGSFNQMNLNVITNDSSDWLYDDISSVQASTISVDLSTMVNNQTQLSSGALQIKPDVSSTYNITPTTLVSERNLTYLANQPSQNNFSTGTFNKTVATNGTIQILPSYDWDRCTGGTSFSSGDRGSNIKSYCFDNSSSTFWESWQSGTSVNGNAYIGYDFSSAVNFNYLSLIQFNSTTHGICSAKLEYSNDGLTYTTLQTLILSTSSNSWQGFIINPNISARYWRLRANDSCSSDWWVYELQMFSPSNLDNITYTSPGVDLSSIGNVNSSSITWNGSNVLVQTSIDNGATWAAAVNGNAISGINGISLSGKTFKYKVQLTNPTGTLNNITAVVGKDTVDGPEITSGKISSISIDSQYVVNGVNQLNPPTTAVFLTDKKPTQILLSGDGNKLFYADPTDSSKLYVLNLLTGETKKIFDNSFTTLKVTYDGSKAAFYRSSDNSLYYYSDSTGVITIASSGVTAYDIQENGTVYYSIPTTPDTYGFYYSNIYQYTSITSSCQITSLFCAQVVGIDASEINGKLFCFGGSYINEIDLTSSGWISYGILTNLTSITSIRTNTDGSVVYILNSGSWYSYKVSTKELCNNATDIYPGISTSDAISMGFNVNLAGSKMASVVYTAGVATGVNTSYSNILKPERYLLSFDGKCSWYTCKDGTWTLVSSTATPSQSDFANYGMTSDEINALTEADFASLYEDGRQIYNVDVAVYFASTDRYTTPSIKSITVTVDNDLNDDSNELTNTSLYTAKKQDFDASSWRKINKIYPVELTPRAADMYYLICVNDTTPKYYSYINGSLQEVTGAAAYISDVNTNWIDITLNAMTAETLRSIPETALTTLLKGKSFSVVYALKVLDTSTTAYSSMINVDYAADYFSGTNTILTITFNDGRAAKSYSNLSDDVVENFMEWLMGRQQNVGPIFYRIGDDFINYYMIQNVTNQ